ncbi:ketosteroid isomerase-like protein [Caulobacter ginsengisoli]|uniref:Ketosteroid isomerase-like protein n=1 Tax=Caulobacter ginsengisoli TaxID=400775 RepID=A0ABU0IXW2_9CAUL|nr:nuclear transport factor 2 family protein [Caulobacter ginsengisoli]MDQ0466171.1 ketosteroid isomerase-like protein [Caulobacter ginsengisoli]
MAVVEAEKAVRARRKLTNRLIAEHEAERLAPFFEDDAKLIAGDGSLILGARAIVKAFTGQFADPDFVAYRRDTEAVELDEAGERAAESGRWAALSKSGEGPSGRYLAVWRQTRGQWRLESELFVTLKT